MAGSDRAALLCLPQRGPRALNDIFRMARQGDWQMRALCWSAAGRIARTETFSLRAARFLARTIPGQRERFPSAGHQGKYVRHFVANGLLDRSWIVRTAAALALGECRSPVSIDALGALLAGPYRAERIAAAAALMCCGERLTTRRAALLDGALPAPARIGDSERTLDFLATLASCHLEVLAAWLRIGGHPNDSAPEGTTSEAWAAFLAGPVVEEKYEGPRKEIERYDADGEIEYLATKPFTPINRIQNTRLLHSFLVAAEHLHLPHEGHVLDLGGGSGWVSELLAKLGYRPITLDVSSALLGIGRARFARAGLTARSVAADMTHLPVASASMDAVVVVDALHHVPDVPAVFREAYRVLVQGGHFVLAEPGEGHSETGKSRCEVMEHGVQEREIHLFEAIDYGRAAGFDDIRVVPHYIPLVTMMPDEVKRAMTDAQDQWTVRQHNRPEPFSQFVLQSMLERPIVVFSKGHRSVDSRMPRKLVADITAKLRRDGVRVVGSVGLRNAGDTIWLCGGDEVGHVRLGIQLLDAERQLLNMEFSRTQLDKNLAPGDSTDVSVSAMLPDAHTRYVLKVDLVDEGFCWFEDVGSRPAYVAL